MFCSDATSDPFVKRTTADDEEWIVYNYVQQKMFCWKRNEPLLNIKKNGNKFVYSVRIKIRIRTAIISRKMKSIMRTYIKMFKAQYSKDEDISSNNGWPLVFEYMCLLAWTVISIGTPAWQHWCLLNTHIDVVYTATERVTVSGVTNSLIKTSTLKPALTMINNSWHNDYDEKSR